MNKEQIERLQELLGPNDGPAPELSAAERAELNALMTLHCRVSIKNPPPIKMCDWCGIPLGIDESDLLCGECSDAVKREDARAAWQHIEGQLSAIDRTMLDRVTSMATALSKEIWEIEAAVPF
jgi:hypothetical protein